MHDRAVGAAVCVLGIVMLVATRRLPAARLGDPAGPTLLPLMLSWAFIALGALLAVRAAAVRTADAAPAPGSAAAGGWRLAAVVVTLAGCTAAFNALGYLVATALMLFLLLAIYNPRRPMQNTLVALSFSLLSYLLFHRVLGVFVPPGLVG